MQEIENFVIEAGSDSLITFGGKFEGGIHCQQVSDEITPFIHDLLSSNIHIRCLPTYLEVGVSAGGNVFLMNHFLHPEKIVLIDDNKHRKTGLRSEILRGINYHEIIGHSAAEETINALELLMDGGKFDLIVLDADHSYISVKLETVLYFPFLKIGGILFLHDSVYASGQVDRVVRELKKDSRMEFIKEYISAHHPLGIALFRKVKE
jgi:predicted O-methyltransferase YrrM